MTSLDRLLADVAAAPQKRLRVGRDEAPKVVRAVWDALDKWIAHCFTAGKVRCRRAGARWLPHDPALDTRARAGCQHPLLREDWLGGF